MLPLRPSSGQRAGPRRPRPALSALTESSPPESTGASVDPTFDLLPPVRDLKFSKSSKPRRAATSRTQDLPDLKQRSIELDGGVSDLRSTTEVRSLATSTGASVRTMDLEWGGKDTSVRTETLKTISQDVSEVASTSGSAESASVDGDMRLTNQQTSVLQALRARDVHVLLTWESYGVVEVPKQSTAVCIVTFIPSNMDSHDLVEDLTARNLSIPLIVLLMRPSRRDAAAPPALVKETKRFLELGAVDVVLEAAMGEQTESCVDMWIARATVRLEQRSKQERSIAESTQQLDQICDMAASREDALFWEHSHNWFEGIPKLNNELQEPCVDGWIGKHHHVLELINSGAFSDVYLVHDKKSQVRAMKAVKKEKLSRYDLVKCISNEVQILISLRHPNVMRFHGSAQSREHIIILLEFVGRINLFNFLKAQDTGSQNVPFDLPLAKKYFHQMISALSYCHDEGVSHRDIKPENFSISDDLTVVKLVDFGMAAPLDSAMKHKGTMPFVAPEVMEEDHSLFDSAAADVWSLGVVLVEIVCGVHALSRMLSWKKSGVADSARATEVRSFLGGSGRFRAALQERMRSKFDLCDDLYALISGALNVHVVARWKAELILKSRWLAAQADVA